MRKIYKYELPVDGGIITIKQCIIKILSIQEQNGKRKDDWCKENNIRLIRIPYTEYDNIDIGYLLSFFPELS